MITNVRIECRLPTSSQVKPELPVDYEENQIPTARVDLNVYLPSLQLVPEPTGVTLCDCAELTGPAAR